MIAHFTTETHISLIIEYVRGGDLFGYLNGRSLSEHKAVCRVLGPLLEALVYIHDRNVVHRDIKVRTNRKGYLGHRVL